MIALSPVERPQDSRVGARPLSLRHIVLTGFMGAGKSTAGALLAARLGWRFIDLDQLLEQRAGVSIPVLFEQYGEADFRRLESTALASALGQSPTVLALGGGAPESLTNRLLLEQTPGTMVIFLDSSFAILESRCIAQAALSTSSVRPLFADPHAAHARFEQRHPLYRQLAHIVVDTSARSPAQTVDAILPMLPLTR